MEPEYANGQGRRYAMQKLVQATVYADKALIFWFKSIRL